MAYKFSRTGAAMEALFDAVDDGTIDEIAGSVSNATTTGSTTNTHLRQVNAATTSTASGEASQVNASTSCTASGAESQVNASDTCTASGANSQINASANGCTATAAKSQVNASDNCDATGTESQVNASQDSVASGTNSMVAASNAGTASGTESSVIASDTCTASGTNASVISGGVSCSMAGGWTSAIASVACTANASASISAHIGSSTCDLNASASYGATIGCLNSTLGNSNAVIIGSNRVISGASKAVCGGYAAAGGAASSNRKWQLNSNLIGGVGIQTAGTVSASAAFADFAEMIENGTGKAIEPGTLLTLIGRHVFPARKGDDVCGVVSATPGSLHGDTPFAWHKKELRDEWGRIVTEKVTERVRLERKTKDGEIEELFTELEIDAPIDSPEFDPERENISRVNRPDEWTICGMLGIILVRVDGSISQKRIDESARERERLYIEPSDAEGIGQLTYSKTNIQAMEVTSEYNEERGYAIVKCKVG